MTEISYNLRQYRAKIKHIAELHARNAAKIELLAVSKGQPFEKILAAYSAEQRDFGENYLQDALPKINAAHIANLQINWHFIGQIQSNKCKAIAEHFAWVQSLSSLKHARRINNARQHAERKPINACVQVQFEQQELRGGLQFEQAAEFIQSLHDLSSIHVRGLMCVLPSAWQPHLINEGYIKLNLLFQQLQKDFPNIDTLSCGMSNDYAQAIENGSTMVRIGRGIFGQR